MTAHLMEQWLRATICTWQGLCTAVRSDAAFRQELIALAIAVPASFVVATGTWQRLALIGVILLVLVVELLNTALEKLCDKLVPDADIEIGRVKDMGSAAVGLSLLIAALAWLLALAEWIRLI
jgi:diacylglycerol kinase (ATP)